LVGGNLVGGNLVGGNLVDGNLTMAIPRPSCKTPFGIKLRHVCNAFLPGQRGKKCEKDHTRPNHK